MAKCNNPTDKINYKNLFKLGTKTYEKEVDKIFSHFEKWFDGKTKDTPVKYFTTTKEMREVGEMVNAYRAETVDMAKNATKMAEFLSNELSDEDSIALTRALGGDGDVPTHLKEVYERFRKVIDTNAQRLVENGALAEESVIKDYLKRYYQEYLEGQGKFSVAMKKVFQRKDLTHEQRLELGMMENADFVISNTILEQNIQLKKAKLLKRIADEFGNDEALDGYVRVSDETVSTGIKKYGALGGMYVPERVHAQLVQAQMVKDTLSILDKSLWTKTIDHVKVNVTVKNPGTHLYNIMSNVSVSYLNGDLGALAKVTKMMVTDREKFKKLVKLARKFGLNNEIEDYETFRVGIDVKKDKNILVKVLKNIYMAEGTTIGEGVRRVYGMEDEIFKLASFYRRIEGKKMSTKTAQQHFKEAMADYVDYSTPLPPLVRRLDRNGVFPFSHYVWKSTPRIAKMIAKNPVKFALLQVALLESGASVFAENDNYEKPDWANDKGFAGYLKFLPSNLFGAKQWVTLENDEYLNLGRALPGMRMGGLGFDGGFVGSFLSIMQGKDPLWGSKIYKESDNTLQASFKSLQKFTENYAPPVTFGRYAQRLIKKATDFHPKKNDYKEEMGYDEILYQILGKRKFNSPKHLLGHYKATLKAYANGNMTHNELDDKLRAILIYGEEHDIDIDMKKADGAYNRYTKEDPKGFWDRWVIP